MPAPRRRLTLAECATVTTAAFEADGDFFGLECEWALRPGAARWSRPDYAALSELVAIPMPAGSRISIEPGGQIEISTLPNPTVAGTLAAMRRDSTRLQSDLATMGLEWDHNAVDTTRPPEIILPSGRYAAMADFWDAGGPAGRWMMNNTSSVQVNVSNDAADPDLRWRVLNAIGPLLVAAFANSGGTDSNGKRWESLRQGIWSSMDPGHTAPVRQDLPAAEAWLSYALAADVFYIRIDESGAGAAVPPGLPFGEWMRRGHELGWPTLDDFRYHLTTLFPPIRAKGWLEVRVIDALPPAWRSAAMLTVAVATRSGVSRELLDVLPHTAGLWRSAARRGLRDPRIDRAARTLMETVLRHADEVEPAGSDMDELLEFVSRFTARSSSPGALRHDALPIGLVAETFDEAETGQTIPLSLQVARRGGAGLAALADHTPSLRNLLHGMGY